MEREERKPAVRTLTPEERYEIERCASYADHKQRGSLGIHYYFYPQDAPRPRELREREDEGRER